MAKSLADNTEPIGRISAIFRYPIKSMACEPLESATIGWYGVEGDRRFAFRKLCDKSGFPWLTAGKLPGLILYQPVGSNNSLGECLPTHVTSPEGTRFELESAELRSEISARFGGEVELMKLKQGIFDAAPISIICNHTINSILGDSGNDIDVRRFRPNIVVDTVNSAAFQEDDWVGRTLVFGQEHDPAVAITMKDERCVMVNFDPDTSERDSRIMKTIVRMNNNHAGVYGTVIRTGRIHIGQSVSIVR